jgi:hypothetical protein
MAQLTITIPDIKLTQYVDWFCLAAGYQSTVFDPVLELNIPNPETKIAFTRRQIIEQLRAQIKHGKELESVKSDTTGNDIS